mmetsp:Transcript_23848/g.20816  ORF Transcript_23848/g.20816 Transcript_23848/m.20816 type:complete len:226 (+) Transcript_23848:1301-1978(+)
MTIKATSAREETSSSLLWTNSRSSNLAMRILPEVVCSILEAPLCRLAHLNSNNSNNNKPNNKSRCSQQVSETKLANSNSNNSSKPNHSHSPNLKNNKAVELIILSSHSKSLIMNFQAINLILNLIKATIMKCSRVSLIKNLPRNSLKKKPQAQREIAPLNRSLKPMTLGTIRSIQTFCRSSKCCKDCNRSKRKPSKRLKRGPHPDSSPILCIPASFSCISHPNTR